MLDLGFLVLMPIVAAFPYVAYLLLRRITPQDDEHLRRWG